MKTLGAVASGGVSVMTVIYSSVASVRSIDARFGAEGFGVALIRKIAQMRCHLASDHAGAHAA